MPVSLPFKPLVLAVTLVARIDDRSRAQVVGNMLPIVPMAACVFFPADFFLATAARRSPEEPADTRARYRIHVSRGSLEERFCYALFCIVLIRPSWSSYSRRTTVVMRKQSGTFHVEINVGLARSITDVYLSGPLKKL